MRMDETFPTTATIAAPTPWKLLMLPAALILSGCGTIWTVGFFGATLSVQFPQPERVTLTATASVTTQPGVTK